MLGKRNLSAPLLPQKRRRKPVSSIEEIQFDPSAREDYLTGFHKRKLQRIRYAKEEAAKKEREERIAARKTLREGRKADLEKHVEAVNTLVRDAAIAAGEIDEEDDEMDDGGEGELGDGVAKPATVDHEEEFIDEDRYTTVTVEAVDVSKDGLHKVIREDEEAGDGSNPHAPGRVAPAAGQGRKRVWTKERPGGPRKKKMKFKYENKAERKLTRYKERSGNKSKAKARKQ